MRLLIIISTCILSFTANGQYTLVPDVNFEQFLIDTGIDSEGILDGQFLTADALGIIGLNFSDRGISDMTGIEAFLDLQTLNANFNNLTFVDTSILPQGLWDLGLAHNQLTSIDLSDCPDIVNIGLNGNNIVSLDASPLTQTYILSLGDNPLPSVNFEGAHIQVIQLMETTTMPAVSF